MRSLFVKTLLWFLFTTTIAIAGFAVVTAMWFTSPEAHHSPFNLLLNVQVEDAKRAYETGGRDALAKVMARFQTLNQATVLFTDASGRDLLTGQPHPELRKFMHPHRRPMMFVPFVPPPHTTISRSDSTHTYWFFLVEPQQQSIFWFLQPAHFVLIAIVVLLCYGFAYHLTSPVERLQRAVDRFGRGEFATRAQLGRKDELGRLATTFNQMADRIQTLLNAERRLLQDISHELRSPLARLCVAVELARSGEDRDAALDRIQKEADRLNALVGELLQVTRAEGDPTQQRSDPVALEDLLRDLVYDTSIEAHAKGAEVTLSILQPATVAGDENLLRRAVENVVRNAIRYAPPGSTVEIALREAGGTAEIGVRDRGPGVPEAALTRIFDAFYRVDSDRNRNSGGVGLGLAIARRAVQLHKGALRAENVGPGLLVTVSLPVIPRTGIMAGNAQVPAAV